MLQDEPRRLRTLFADARATGPAMGVDEGCQASRMTLMQRFHTRMVTLEERPVAGQVLEQREVAAGHLEQLCTDGVPVGRHRVRYAAARKATRPSAPPNARTRGGNTRLGSVEYRRWKGDPLGSARRRRCRFPSRPRAASGPGESPLPRHRGRARLYGEDVPLRPGRARTECRLDRW